MNSLMNIDDMIHFTLREWTRMSMSPGDAEVERAKSQLKASLLLGLDGTTAIAEDVRLILLGYYVPHPPRIGFYGVRGRRREL
jgi:hypothetical protein